MPHARRNVPPSGPVRRAVGAVLALAWLTSAVPAHADRIWRYLDANGQVVYSNQPPKTVRGKPTVIDTPSYGPPARRTGPTWAEVFGAPGAARTAQADLDPGFRLPSPAANGVGNPPLPTGFRVPPSGDAPPLPPLPGDVAPPAHLPGWPTVTPPLAASTPVTTVAPEPPAEKQAGSPAAPETHAAPAMAASPAHAPVTPSPAAPPSPHGTPTATPPHVRAPSPASWPSSSSSSHPASAPAAVHPDHPKP